MYVRDIFDKRTVFGEFYHLVQELRESDPEYHFQYFRMTKASFDKLLGLVHDRLVHAPTHRSPISPAERLAITLSERRGARVDGQWRADILHVGVNRSLGGNSSPAAISIRDQLADHFISPRGAIPWQPDIVARE
ncbi:hypothetical protein HPB47_009804 [Ixodes persulcatus]|uniref:Uncharacterized protein n=1 Tax=Ixodes persulcatus TaxID=34615 RepID=A0AC60P1F5_IXOPE|nr:hypothetical protein HPB47_009804 [Ixodes persulcatus]